MKPINTLFQLKNYNGNAFDGSPNGVAIKTVKNVQPLKAHKGFKIREGVIEIARNKHIDNLQTFSLEAKISPNKIGEQRQNIMEAQTPAVALFINKQGKLVGSVHTENGWKKIDSGRQKLKEGKEYNIEFNREKNGDSELVIDGETVSSQTIKGPIENVGDKGFNIGAWIDGRRFSFDGAISDVKVSSGRLDRNEVQRKIALSKQLREEVIRETDLTRVIVNLIPDESRARLQPIKDIMNAAGIENLSELGTLKVRKDTRLVTGKVMVAPAKTEIPSIDWSNVVDRFFNSGKGIKKKVLAKHLTNRNSAKILRKFSSEPDRDSNSNDDNDNGGNLNFRILNRGIPNLRFRRVNDFQVIKNKKPLPAIPDLFDKDRDTFKKRLKPDAIIDVFEKDNPALWPNTSPQKTEVLSYTTIPIDSAVIIANTLDLTDKKLVVEPDVSTLYIIANKIECNDNAQITWRRPSSHTPDRHSDPALNGRSWSGEHTREGSRHGLNGGDGRSGVAGIDGAHGANAPNLEIWVKDMNSMPNIDFNGRKGAKGGQGQPGGSGGNGADGHVGKRAWFFGWHCTKDPGDGGHGGNGGDGGRGGRGGNGGNGGDITIGVLEDTLEETVTSRAFRLKNQGNDPGVGGDGGPGGDGGRGGRSGNGETCHDARAGRDGAQGQPGPDGPSGAHSGVDGEIEFFEFDEEAWEELLTRPWITEVNPTEVFPGDSITVKGSNLTSSDKIVIDGRQLTPTLNPDDSLSLNIPLNISGGEKSIFIRRSGEESNRHQLWIKPQLNVFNGLLSPGANIVLRGHAFVSGASVLVDGSAIPATVNSATELAFKMPTTGGSGSSGGTSSLQVRNPDGMISNMRTASRPLILEIPFKFGVHNLPFANFDDGIPDWSTYEDTYGATEVRHELLDPLFGHPILTAAFFVFYKYFLKGEANGGLATGFCTSLAALVADKFWQGDTDTNSVAKSDVHKMLTAVHGKLLSRESLIHFHDQGREGISRVETTCREIEATFLRGCDRSNMPLLFFIPAGAIWDEGYVDDLADSHCVMPYRFVYPDGHPGPSLSADGSTTITNLDGVELYVWDCNDPDSENSRLVFQQTGGELHYEFIIPDGDGGEEVQFSSEDGITLGMMTNGDYLLADHDLPFSGPHGVKRFIIDFLLSPAELEITDDNGMRTGNFDGQILSEIQDSHPCYLVKGAYLLPENKALSRNIVGTGSGKYSYHSIMPNGTSISIEDVDTEIGHEDRFIVNQDATQLRFQPSVQKIFSLTLARQVDDQVRAMSITGLGGKPGAEVDITVSPELSLLRVGNRDINRNVSVKAFTIDQESGEPLHDTVENITLPQNHDLAIGVSDWTDLNLNVDTVSF